MKANIQNSFTLLLVVMISLTKEQCTDYQKLEYYSILESANTKTLKVSFSDSDEGDCLSFCILSDECSGFSMNSANDTCIISYFGRVIIVESAEFTTWIGSMHHFPC